LPQQRSGIDGNKIAVNIVELAVYRCFDSAAGFLLLGNTEEACARPTAFVSGAVVTQGRPLNAEIINDPFG
jgi:hypothetical protein